MHIKLKSNWQLQNELLKNYITIIGTDFHFAFSILFEFLFRLK